MDTLNKKRFETFNYVCRYTPVPYYFDTLGKRDVYGLTSNMVKTTAHYTHKVKDDDTLHGLALKYYNNPSYWWVIAYFNDIQDAFVKLSDHYQVLQIPSISSIEFGNERK